jgi:hypothetical protein
VLRGALGGWAVRIAGMDNSSDDFKNIFYEKRESDVSFPMCYYKGHFPAPLSLFAPKSSGDDQHAALLKTPPKVLTQLNINSDAIGAPVDFLKRDKWPSQVNATLKPMKNYNVDGALIVKDQSVSLSIKNRHHEEKRRVGDDGLFVEQVIQPGNYYEPKKRYFKGTFYYPEKYKKHFKKLIDDNVVNEGAITSEKLENPEPKHTIFVGHRRIATLIYGINYKTIKPDQDMQQKIDGEFSVTFTSDFIPNKFTYPLSVEHIDDQLFGVKLYKIRSFCGMTRTHGYDVLSREARIPAPAFAAGSCIYLKCDSALTDETKQHFRQKSQVGIGRNTKDGYGRFIINWHIHNIEEAS